jgi:hypothetical protein
MSCPPLNPIAADPNTWTFPAPSAAELFTTNAPPKIRIPPVNVLLPSNLKIPSPAFSKANFPPAPPSATTPLIRVSELKLFEPTESVVTCPDPAFPDTPFATRKPAELLIDHV